jgi:hypothetical protein
MREIPDIPHRKQTILTLASVHDQVARDVTQAVAGIPAFAGLKDPKAIVEQTVTSNRGVAGADRDAYVPFFTALDKEVLTPIRATTLATAGGHIQVWKDIAAGLRAAANSQ